MGWRMTRGAQLSASCFAFPFADSASRHLRLSPAFVMSAPILRLAQTELRLVAHYLDAKQLMRMARCSKVMMAGLDSPFTFKHCTLAVMCCRTPLRLSSLFRHLPLLVYWMIPAGVLAATMLDVMPLLGSNLTIRSFDASDCLHVPVRLWYALLADPAISRVAELIVTRSNRQMSMDWTFLDRVTKLPNLRSLSLGRTSGKARWAWNRLTPPPSLTSLHITDASQVAGDPALVADSCVPWIGQCTGLQSLHLSRPRLFDFPDPDKLSFFQSATMRALIELKLESCVFGAGSAPLLLSAFTLLSSLRLLHLFRWTLDAEVMVAVSSPPALRTMILEADRRSGRWKELEQRPDFNLLEHRPLLQVIIRKRPACASLIGLRAAAYFAIPLLTLQHSHERLHIERAKEDPWKPDMRERGHQIVPRFDRGLRKESRRVFGARDTSLDRTPDVLVQLLFQFADLRSLLCLARCSWRLRQLADTPRVWSHLQRPLTQSLLPHTRSRLLRHVPLTVNCYQFGGVGLFDRMIRAYPLLNIVETNMRYPDRGPNYVFLRSRYESACMRLLQRSAMERVEVLRMCCHLARWCSWALPRLRLLDFETISYTFEPHDDPSRPIS